MENQPFTVQRLLQLPLFKGVKVMAGSSGLSKEIFYVDFMETPTLTGFLRPNELILTTGYSIRHEPAMLGRLLDEMHRVGGAAVGIKTKRFLHEVPQEALQKSDLYGIPLFDIPLEITYVDMTHTVIDQILSRQAYLLREVREVNQQFTNLVLNRRTTELVVLIGHLLGCEAAVLNEHGEVESCTSRFGGTAFVEKRPVQVGSKVMGYLAISRKLGDQETFEEMCLDHAITVLAIDFTIRQSQQLHREREQESFLVELFSGSSHQEDLLRYRAQQLGIPLGRYFYTMVLQPRSGGEQGGGEQPHARLYNLLVQRVNKPGNHTRKGVFINDSLIILVSTAHDSEEKQRADAEQLLRELMAPAEELPPQARMCAGIGGLREKLSDVPDSRLEAHKALSIGTHTLPKQEIVHFHEVLVEDLLLDAAGHPVLNALTSMLIEPLVAYDLEYGTELLATLSAFLRLGGNTKRVAEELFIHRNSVLYRLERINEIIQNDLTDPEVRFRLDVAIRVWKTKDIDSKSMR